MPLKSILRNDYKKYKYKRTMNAIPYPEGIK